MFLKFIYFCKTFYMFHTVSPSIIRGTRLHIQCQAFVQFCAPDDGWKNCLKHVEHLTEINKFEKRSILLVVLWELISHYDQYHSKKYSTLIYCQELVQCACEAAVSRQPVSPPPHCYNNNKLLQRNSCPLQTQFSYVYHRACMKEYLSTIF